MLQRLLLKHSFTTFLKRDLSIVDAKKIIELFDFFDSNKDGKLDLSDFITILEHYDKIPVKHSFTYKKKGKK